VRLPRSSRAIGAGIFVLALGIAITAFNMRTAIVGVGPLIDAIRDDTGISATVAGLLTTLPVVCFGALAGVAPRLAHRFGIDLMIWLTMVGLTIGILIRAANPLPMLFLGTVVIGGSIALANVLVPAAIKRDFPERTGLMTGVYTMGIAAGGSLAAGLMVPILENTSLGWRGTLGTLAVPSLLAVVALLPRLRMNRASQATSAANPVSRPSLWKSRLAWQVSLFMGLQSFAFFGLGTWTATLLIDSGLSEARAGLMWSLCNLAGLPVSMAAPLLAQRFHDQRVLVVVVETIWAAAVVGLLLSPASWTILWMILFGIGAGSSLSLALMFIVLRSPDAGHAASLSGMAQAVGYTIAASAPFLFGALRDLTGGWEASMVMILIVLGLTMLFGWQAGRRAYVTGEAVR
jgi:CP family cyanate transporter-like MFS transporter